MYRFAHKVQKKPILHSMFKILNLSICFSLIFSPLSFAQTIPLLNLPQPGAFVAASPQFVPVLLKGLTINVNNPFQFDFIVDSGNAKADKEQVKEEAQHLVKYFLASLTIPKDNLWVNLSPYEKERVIPQELSKTELGRDMLAQDYLLKQLTASFIHPDKDLGKKFWDRVYQQAKEKYGTTEIPVNTFNKVWILPERARVFEKGNTAYVVDSHLKVMMDEDYQALAQNSSNKEKGTDKLAQNDVQKLSNLSSVIMKEIVLPAIEKEVNEGKNFAQIRQIYHSLILAKWYKETVKESLLSKIYIDKNKTAGVDVNDKTIKDKIYEQYVAAYKKGVFDLIKEDYDPAAQEVVPRKYFSGGELLVNVPLTRTGDPAEITKAVGNNYRLSVVSTPQRGGANFSMMAPFARISPLHDSAIDEARRNTGRLEKMLEDKKIGSDVVDIPDQVLQEVNRFPVSTEGVPEASIPENMTDWLGRDEGKLAQRYFDTAKEDVANGRLVKFLPWGGQATRAAAILGGGAKSLFSLKNFANLNLLDENQFPLKAFDEKDEGKAKQIRQYLIDFQLKVKEQISSAKDDAFKQYLMGLSLGAHQVINYRVQLENLARERNVPSGEIDAFVKRNGKFIVAVNNLTGEGIVDEFVNNNFFGFDQSNIVFVQQDTLPPFVRIDGKFVPMTDQMATDLGLSAPIRVTYNHGYIANQLKTIGAGFVVGVDAQGKAQIRYIEDKSPYQYMIDRGGQTMTNANIDDNPQLTEEVLPLTRLAFAKYLMETKGVKTVAEVLENKSGQKGGFGLKKVNAPGDIVVEGTALKLFDIKNAFLNRMLIFTDLASQQAVTENPRIHWDKKKIKTAAGKEIIYFIPESYFTDAVTWFVPTVTFFSPGLAINAFKQPWNVVKRDLSSDVPGTGPMMIDLHADPGFNRVTQNIYSALPANRSSMGPVVDELLKPVQELRKIRTGENQPLFDDKTEAMVALASIQTDETPSTIHTLLKQLRLGVVWQGKTLSDKAAAVLALAAARSGKNSVTIGASFRQFGAVFTEQRIPVSNESLAYYTLAANQPGQNFESILQIRRDIEQWISTAPRLTPLSEEAIAILTLTTALSHQTAGWTMSLTLEIYNFLDQIERVTTDEAGAFLTLAASLSVEKNLQRFMSQAFKMDTDFMTNGEQLSDEALAIYTVASTQLKPLENRSMMGDYMPMVLAASQTPSSGVLDQAIEWLKLHPGTAVLIGVGVYVGTATVLALFNRKSIPMNIDLLANSKLTGARVVAARTLGNSGIKSAQIIIALSTAAESDSDLTVRKEARAALEKLTGQVANWLSIGLNYGDILNKIKSGDNKAADKIDEAKKNSLATQFNVTYSDNYDELFLDALEMLVKFGDFNVVSRVSESPAFYGGETSAMPDHADLNVYKVIVHPASNDNVNRSVMAGTADQYGGIDMNQIYLEREGDRIDIQFNPAQMQNILTNGIDGLAPVIINIVPVSNVMPFLGLEPEKGKELELSSVK